MKTLFKGHFITGSEDTWEEDSKSKSEFEWCLDKIGGNTSCILDEVIFHSSYDKLPEYARSYIERGLEFGEKLTENENTVVLSSK